jgi:CheY-like chemotaxis protein
VSKSQGKPVGERRKSTVDRARRLLILDHDAWSRALADGLLRGRGYRVVCTGDAEMALRLARETIPDLLLVDLSMKALVPAPRRSGDPESVEAWPVSLDGYALLRPLEIAPVPAGQPVVVLRPVSTEAKFETGEAVRFALAALLPKPFTPETLLGKVADILGGPSRRLEETVVRQQLENDGMLLGGRIEVVGVPGILQMCHNTMLSGVCTLETLEGVSVKVYFHRGEIVAASGPDGESGGDSVAEVVSWTGGRFDFVPGEPDEQTPLGTFDALLLEGCRRMDEREHRRSTDEWERLSWRTYPSLLGKPEPEA